jgi:hypothetical protein
MKVVCIDNNNVNLTRNKIYDIFENKDYDGSSSHHHIKNDSNKLMYYPKNLFKSIEEIREERLNTILG